MALEKTLRDVPITLPYPWDHPVPKPKPGCDVCGALNRQIAHANDPKSDEYNPSKVSDLRVEMARHHAGKVSS
ncbi:hypothetical protein [Streptomyces collinus]|uniref:hypothetical protein n=1 Tax=Streptomyces collinus TaxID=42684 RepID=UPI0036CDE7E8